VYEASGQQERRARIWLEVEGKWRFAPRMGGCQVSVTNE